LLILEDKLERAIELLSFVNAYHGTWYEDRKPTLRSLNELKSQIKKKEYQDAFNRGKERGFDEVVMEVSEELGVDLPEGILFRSNARIE
jgi:hypothetical protein